MRERVPDEFIPATAEPDGRGVRFRADQEITLGPGDEMRLMVALTDGQPDLDGYHFYEVWRARRTRRW